MVKLSMLEIILKTFSFYNLTNRAQASGGCCFYNWLDNGVLKHCAFGMWMKPEFKNFMQPGKEACGWGFVGSVAYFANREMKRTDLETYDDLLIDEVKGYSEDFWRFLQRVHDNAANFTETGLTHEGNLAVLDLIERFVLTPQNIS